MVELAGKVSIEDPGKDDFELWSPSEGRKEICLFGRRVRMLVGIRMSARLQFFLGVLSPSEKRH
jgi:hypothetical protein